MGDVINLNAYRARRAIAALLPFLLALAALAFFVMGRK